MSAAEKNKNHTGLVGCSVRKAPVAVNEAAWCRFPPDLRQMNFFPLAWHSGSYLYITINQPAREQLFAVTLNNSAPGWPKNSLALRRTYFGCVKECNNLATIMFWRCEQENRTSQRGWGSLCSTTHLQLCSEFLPVWQLQTYSSNCTLEGREGPRR